MKPVTFLPEVTRSAVRSVVLPERPWIALTSAIGLLALGLGWWVLVEQIGSSQGGSNLRYGGIISAAAGGVLVCRWAWLHLSVHRVFSRAATETLERGPITLQDAGLAFSRSGRDALYTWSQMRRQLLSSEAILLEAKDGSRFVFATSQLVETGCFTEFSRLLDKNVPRSSEDEFTWDMN